MLVYRANILLDKAKNAKLADFGFSIELPQLSHGKTMFTAQNLPRTEGYFPSEITSGHYSDRSDVYCYGVVSDSIVGHLQVHPLAGCFGNILWSVSV